MTTWVTPRTWDTGEDLTAARLNTIRENLSWLKTLLTDGLDDGDSVIRIRRAAAASAAYEARAGADVSPRFTIRADGRLEWGAGGEAEPDVWMARETEENEGQPLLAVAGTDDGGLFVVREVVSGQGLLITAETGQIDLGTLSVASTRIHAGSITFINPGVSYDLSIDPAGAAVLLGATPRFGVQTNETGLANALFYRRTGDVWPRAVLGQDGDGRARLLLSAGTGSSADVELYRESAKVGVFNDFQARFVRADPANPALVIGDTAGNMRMHLFAGGWMQYDEISAPANPSANSVRLYAQDNGSGKTQLMAKFGSGGGIPILTEA